MYAAKTKNRGGKVARYRYCQGLVVFILLFPLQAVCEEPEFVNPPAALSVNDVLLPNLTGIVSNFNTARVLGKALYWDTQLGSDNLACASCHFHAGVDSRSKNQLSPSLLRMSDLSRTGAPDTTFGDTNGKTGSGEIAAPNYNLTPTDFPLHRTQDMKDRNTPIIYDTNDVVSSQGSFGGFLLATDPDPTRFPDFCGGEDTTFTVNGVPVRKVEPRNAPTTINAVFNHRNFWDGRANNIFNGVNPFGARDPDARVVAWDNTTGLALEEMRLANASLASQAVGPPLSAFEMACSGRSFKDLGRGMLPLRALATQSVHLNDSVLGATGGYRHASGLGLNKTYENLVREAFDIKYWGDNNTKFVILDKGSGPEIDVPVDSGLGFTQIEHNFSMFFGIAIMLYEATLVSNETPYDTFIKFNPVTNTGPGTLVAQAGAASFVAGFGPRELLGLDVFMNKGKCYECHFGPEFTSASIRVRGNFPAGDVEPVENMVGMDGRQVLYDGGFYNIGVRPTSEDLGIGGQDPFGNNPLSFSRQLTNNNAVDPGLVLPTPNPFVIDNRTAVDGAFKTPTIRNVELTGPYMHNGGHSTLRQVVEFYNRGGDRRDLPGIDECFGVTDTTGFGDDTNESRCTNVHPVIVNLNLTENEIDALVAFMLSLTDDRVKGEKAPFDHPELIIPNGHQGSQLDVETVEVIPENPSGEETLIRAKDTFQTLPAVGAGGRHIEGLLPLEPFLRLNPFSLDQPKMVYPRSVVPRLTPLLLEN